MQLLALRHGDKDAIVNVERNRRISFREFHLLTNRIANAMRSVLGLELGDRFFVALENDNLALMHFPTVFKQEATAVFTNLRDAVGEHLRQVDIVKPKVAFIETALLASHGKMLEARGCAVVVMDPMDDAQKRSFVNVRCLSDVIAEASDAETGIILDQREHLAVLRFTGGTTGHGKCAMYCIDNWLFGRETALVSPDLQIDADTRTLHVSPLSHGSMTLYLPTLFAGGTTLTMNTVDLDRLRSVVDVEQVTHTFLVPTAMYRLLELQREQPVTLNSLRTILYGAAPINPVRLNELTEVFGRIFTQAYSATEASCLVSLLDKVEHRVDSELAIKRLSSAGRPTAGTEVFITDEAGKPVPLGERGEIRIRCRSIIKGYYQNPEATAAEFEDGAWRSGDLGYMDEDGFIYIVDRLKDMIISGGFNVYAAEVEAALGSHPVVLNSAVVGIPHADWGEAVHAEVILRDGMAATPDELIAHVKARLGSYKAPKSITLVDSLPTSAVGKVLRRHVRSKYLKAASPGPGEAIIVSKSETGTVFAPAPSRL